jgi:chromosome segregation protein
MHIKKLEICGFKSFVDRTVIHFDHDMIGVVGPNGCGKSNVVDAIRWAMGEQSAKALRGKGMGDVIFNGSESRSQAGFAEVTLTFDNSNAEMAQTLPLEYRDYAEIAVTRRIYRGDGSNDYFINKAPVRLRDVTEVFLGTGVGRKAYSIVEQGKIGIIVSAKPEDRRSLIEEAAGITKYKARKRQAENKMNLTRQNLTRVTDIVNEIERQLESLKRQAAKARRFVKYRDELDDLLLWEASHKLLELTATTQVARNSHEETTERVQAERASVDARDAELEVLRHTAKDAEHAAEQAQNLAFMSDNEVREYETRIDRAGDRYRHLEQRLRQAQLEQETLDDKAGELGSEHEQLDGELTTIQAEQSREQELLDHELGVLEALRMATDAASEHVTDLRRLEANAAAAIARSEAELRRYEHRRNEMTQRRQRQGDELGRLDAERTELVGRGEALRSRVGELVNKKHAMCDARDAIGHELPFLEGHVEHGGKELDELRAELHQKKSRLQALREVAERMEGIGAGVRNLLATGDVALGGMVADRIEVSAEHTNALAGLVGDRLQTVVVEDLDRALELLRGLASDRRGRATIIPRSVDRADTTTEALPMIDGVIGLMVDQVRFAPEDEGAVRALVGDAVLVEDASQAQRLRAHGLSSDVVTLDGTVFHADGRVTGGAGDAFASGLLENKREMRGLEELVMGLSMQARTRGDDLADKRERLSQLRRALDQAKAQAHEAELAMVTGEQDLQRLEQRLALVDKRHNEVEREVAEIAAHLDEANADYAATTTTLAAAQAERVEAATGLAEAEKVALTKREELAHQQASYTERKVQLASVNERAGACRTALDRIDRELGELSRRIANLEAEREDGAFEAGMVAAELFEVRASLLEARTKARQAQSAFENARLGLDDARHGLGLREAELREMRARLDDLSSALREHDMALHRLVLEREHLDEAIRDRFRGLELRTVVGDFHARRQVGEEERDRIKELSRLIDRMGAVNLEAVKEYEESSQRFLHYTEQRADLETALGDLEKAIHQMNKQSKRLFRHAFDGVNRRFKDIFPKMFRGGRAELRLTNPDDMLETGIEILAQPPGKRVANIELMSGGEKAFTAVSLLLALFRFKPSPFCILDEVDAPLDEANVARYVEAIRAMTDRSQFIVITHSKRTMEAVDVLYGVTMQEPGVSKLVGVKVGDRAERSVTARSERSIETSTTAEGVAKAEGAPPTDEVEVAESDTQVA